MKLLEVIVTSAEEAKAAQVGGADRLELIRDPALGGLTPEWATVESVLAAVHIPVRVMLRRRPTFTAGSEKDRDDLLQYAALLKKAQVDGVVLGFLEAGGVDSAFLSRILSALDGKNVTFHRAIEAVDDLQRALLTIRQFRQIDKVLSSGGAGTWPAKLPRLEDLQWSLGPGIRLISGGGLDSVGVQTLRASPALREFHVGRAARTADGQVSPELIAKLKNTLRQQAEIPVAG